MQKIIVDMFKNIQQIFERFLLTMKYTLCIHDYRHTPTPEETKAYGESMKFLSEGPGRSVLHYTTHTCSKCGYKVPLGETCY